MQVRVGLITALLVVGAAAASTDKTSATYSHTLKAGGFSGVLGRGVSFQCVGTVSVGNKAYVLIYYEWTQAHWPLA